MFWGGSRSILLDSVTIYTLLRSRLFLSQSDGDDAHGNELYSIFCGNTYPDEEITTCRTSYTSISGRSWTEPGTYTDTVPGGLYCDSIVTFDLTILGTLSEISAEYLLLQ